MLNRIKTLPLPTIARHPRSLTHTASRTAPMPAHDGSPIVVVGDSREAAQARVIVGALEGELIASAGSPPVVLVSADALPASVDGAHRTWMISRLGADIDALVALSGIAGIVVDPVTARMVAALVYEADDALAEGTQPSTPSRTATVAATILEDSDRHLDQLATAFGAAECRVWIREAQELRSVARGDALAPAAARMSADTGLPVVVDDGRDVSTWIALWCARTGEDEPTGLLALRHDGVWTPGAALADLDIIASRFAVELSWLRIHRRVVFEQERLRAAAMVEPLTGAWTRAAFDRTVEIEIAAARRRGEVLSMVVFDVDELRRINDQHGHAAGDAVLAHVAGVVRANVRVNDVLGRFGDDEIAVVLMNADLDRSKMVAEKLVRKIIDTPLLVAGERIRFTVRSGVTSFDVEHERNGDAGFVRAMRGVEYASAQPSRVGAVTVSAVIPTVTGLDEDAQVGTPVGQTLGGGYRILHEINRGANGVVYRGEDLGLGRPVAIKVLRHDLGRDQDLVEHFRREASILASLRHPNLVQVYAFGAADDVYFVMELVEGPTVADVVDDAVLRGEWLDADAVSELVTQIADALEAMHNAGLVHCDVKPENVILDRNAGRAVLVDVGECKRHDEGRRRAGTPGYAAPESFAEGEETAAIDVYSLAATAYMMITARLPFGVGDALSILARQLDAAPPAPSSIRRGIPDAVDVVLAKAMAVEPSQRFTTPGSFAMALRAALRGTDQSADLPAPEPRVGQLRELTVAEGDALICAEELGASSVIRGAAFRVAAKVLAARVGEPWLRRVAEGRRELAEVVHASLPPMSWQPLDLLLDLIDSVTGASDRGEILRTIGRGMVSVTFGHLYGADPSSMSVHGLLGSVPRLWSRYFGAGGVEVIGAGDGRISLGVSHWSADPSAPHLVAGFLERIAELTGAFEVKVSVTSNSGKHMFTVEWSDDVSQS